MKTIAIPQFYCGPSGQKGLYNRQEVGLARAFAALGCRAVSIPTDGGGCCKAMLSTHKRKTIKFKR